jgi:polyphosphate kinase
MNGILLNSRNFNFTNQLHKKMKYKYVPRDISWLSFNGRVLQEANDTTVSLKDRIRFLGIFSNNLDEFFRLE